MYRNIYKKICTTRTTQNSE